MKTISQNYLKKNFSMKFDKLVLVKTKIKSIL
jgi:hypothetical protein